MALIALTRRAFFHGDIHGRQSRTPTQRADGVQRAASPARADEGGKGEPRSDIEQLKLHMLA